MFNFLRSEVGPLLPYNPDVARLRREINNTVKSGVGKRNPWPFRAFEDYHLFGFDPNALTALINSLEGVSLESTVIEDSVFFSLMSKGPRQNLGLQLYSGSGSGQLSHYHLEISPRRLIVNYRTKDPMADQRYQDFSLIPDASHLNRVQALVASAR